MIGLLRSGIDDTSELNQARIKIVGYSRHHGSGSDLVKLRVLCTHPLVSGSEHS